MHIGSQKWPAGESLVLYAGLIDRLNSNFRHARICALLQDIRSFYTQYRCIVDPEKTHKISKILYT